MLVDTSSRRKLPTDFNALKLPTRRMEIYVSRRHGQAQHIAERRSSCHALLLMAQFRYVTAVLFASGDAKSKPDIDDAMMYFGRVYGIGGGCKWLAAGSKDVGGHEARMNFCL